LQGKGEASGKKWTIALRADIDALPMPEDNPHLEYRSTTDFAHMCGHDGHTAMLLMAAQIL
jgi:metal-dependent amidase/aminoacylase/carboxypeptidase family protein